MSGLPAQLGYPDANTFLIELFLYPWLLIGPTPEMGLTSIPLVSNGVDDVIPYLETTTLMGSIPFN